MRRALPREGWRLGLGRRGGAGTRAELLAVYVERHVDHRVGVGQLELEHGDAAPVGLHPRRPERFLRACSAATVLRDALRVSVSQRRVRTIGRREQAARRQCAQTLVLGEHLGQVERAVAVLRSDNARGHLQLRGRVHQVLAALTSIGRRQVLDARLGSNFGAALESLGDALRPFGERPLQ